MKATFVFFLCALFWLCSRANGSIGIDSRLYFPNSAPTSIQIGGEYLEEFLSFLELDANARLQQSSRDLERFQYGARVLAFIPGISGFRVGAFGQFQQDCFFPYASSAGAIAGGGFLDIQFANFLGFYLRLGRSLRWYLPSRTTLIPYPFLSETSENEYVVEMFLQLSLASIGKIDAGLGNLENLEIYRLNHPYVELAWTPSSTTLEGFRFYSRLYLLLGFGRTDSWVFGASMAL